MFTGAGPGARTVLSLWWLMFWIAAAVVVIVIALLVYSLRRRAENDKPGSVPRWGGDFVVTVGFAIPAVILLVVYLVSLGSLRSLADTGETQLTVDVVGHMWWWEADYPDGATTANEIHIPVGEPVELVLTTADVIHSFWIPALHPKKDMIPGQENTLTIEADEPGRYRGSCAEFCGLQHANMGVFVVADPEFDSWLAGQADSAVDTETEGRDVFLGSTCVGCHTIRGTTADARVGPDLTHVASRDTLFAGRVNNTREGLMAIITDPQSVKPGVAMPPTDLSASELDSLVDYLESLE
jgi:cytochrome c oxidase subunit 2